MAPVRNVQGPIYQPLQQLINQYYPKRAHQSLQVLWVSPEGITDMTGGLGEITNFVARGINVEAPVNMVMITPETKPYLEKAQADPDNLALQWEDTGVRVSVNERPGWLFVAKFLALFVPGAERKERLIQRLSPHGEFILKRNKAHRNEFTLGSPFYTQRFKSLFYNYKIGITKSEDENANASTKQNKSDALILFNKAVLKALPYLQGQKPVEGNPVFEPPVKGLLDIAIANDWPIAPLLTQNLKKATSNSALKTLFYIHNTYSQTEYESWIQKILPLPSWLRAFSNSWFGYFEQGVQLADAVIGNHNFLETVTETNFARGGSYRNHLKQLLKTGRAYDMHHFLPKEMGPDQSPWLQKEGFVPFKAMSLLNEYVSDLAVKEPSRELKQAYFEFKGRNKQAFQAWTQTLFNRQKIYNDGKIANYLATDPNAVLIGFQNRLDPFQKGFHLIIKAAQDFLTRHPDAQLALAGGADDVPGLKEWAQAMTAQFPGRFWMPLGRYESSVDDRLHAAGDVFLNPSLYEPFGISHLKSMKFLRPVVGSAVDGLRWSLSDDDGEALAEKPDGLANHFRSMPGGPAKNYKRYGAFGFLFDWNNMPLYRQALGKILGLSDAEQIALQKEELKYSMTEREAALTPEEKVVIEDNVRRFSEALERSYQTAKNPNVLATMALSAYKYVTVEHDPLRIFSRYYVPQFLHLLQENLPQKGSRPTLEAIRKQFDTLRVRYEQVA
ncbi:MAG: glycosyltransferase [Vampirovibrionales bacterium]